MMSLWRWIANKGNVFQPCLARVTTTITIQFDLVDDAVVIRVEPLVIDQCTWTTNMGNAL